MRKLASILIFCLLAACAASSCTTQKYASASFSDSRKASVKKDEQNGKEGDQKAGDDLESVLADLNGPNVQEAPFYKGALSLDACVDKALELNRKRPASRAAIAMAEAKHQQALSSYWPQLSLQGSVNMRSSDPNYIFPSREFALPPTAINVPAGSFNTPVTSIPTAFGPISVPSQEIAVPGRTFEVPSQTFHLDEQIVKVKDRRSAGAKVDMKWLLWSKGWRDSLSDQARAGIAAAEEDARRTDLEIVYDVRRMHSGALLARKVEKIGRDTLSRIEVTLQLTENLYKGGSMTVTKTDYLRNKVLAEGLRSMVNRLEENRQLAESALANSMGYNWKSEVRPAESSLAFHPLGEKADDLIANAYEFNPDWRQLEAGLQAAEAKVREEESTYAPRVALIGNLHGAESPFRGGYSTDENLNAWNIGIGVEMPLFDGYMTRSRIEEAKARLDQLKQQKLLLHEGLALQVKVFLVELGSMEKQDRNNRAALSSANENRELSEKAYRNDLIEADKVFESQIMEAITEARHLKLRFDHQITRAKLDLLVGKEFQDRMQSIAPRSS